MDSNLWYGGTRAGHFRASRASRVAPSTTAPRSRRACMRLPDARTHPGLSEWSDHLIWSWTKYRSVASDVMPSAVPGMKTLYLLRHAKSSWKDPGLDDLDRRLRAKPCKKIVDIQVARPSSWKRPCMATCMAR